MKRRTLQLLLLAAVSSASALGQINCASGPDSQKLVCEFPFSTGVLKYNAVLYGGTGALLQQKALAAASVFNNAVATQVSQLPLASASAGTVVLYKAGVPETFNNLGPILTDRAQTVGRHRFFLGFTASQFVFTDIDGISLGKLPFSYEVQAFSSGTPSTVLSSTYTSQTTKLSLKVNQFIGVATYGLTNRIDLSVVVPIERVSLGATTYNSEAYIFNANNVFVYGPTSSPNSYTPGTASGVGDITINGKTEIWTGERATFAGAINVRVPSGDDKNYLGSGAWGFDPYLVYSYLAKISPHAKIGYQWNTSTELNNPTDSTGGNLALPGGMQYDLGADWALVRHITVAGDLLGSQYINAPKLMTTAAPLPTSSPVATLPSLTTQDSSYTINDFSAGLKWNPFRNLVLSGNVLFQLNNTGVRARPTPLVGISYKF